MKRVVLFLCLISFAAVAYADKPAPPETQLVKPGERITFDKLDQEEAFGRKGKPGANGWRAGIGEWSVVDGAGYAKEEGPSEKRPRGHEAVCEHIVDLGDLVLTGEFKLGPAPQVGFVCRDTHQPNHHLGRVLITPSAIWIQKMSGIAKETRKEELKRIKVDIDPNTWHKVTVEVKGDRWLVRVDDHVLEGSHERFLDRKGRVGFVARGEGAQFRNVAIWKAAE
ncbi:family 16 glycoside hydrolase [Bremerella sp. JC817]|uniref:family 16 glycoside hydrolase n=1 Tax=Bremerella sp. JC817 TaxID=3231756 RepID=UPI00345A8CF6